MFCSWSTNLLLAMSCWLFVKPYSNDRWRKGKAIFFNLCGWVLYGSDHSYRHRSKHINMLNLRSMHKSLWSYLNINNLFFIYSTFKTVRVLLVVCKTIWSKMVDVPRNANIFLYSLFVLFWWCSLLSWIMFQCWWLH